MHVFFLSFFFNYKCIATPTSHMHSHAQNTVTSTRTPTRTNIPIVPCMQAYMHMQRHIHARIQLQRRQGSIPRIWGCLEPLAPYPSTPPDPPPTLSHFLLTTLSPLSLFSLLSASLFLPVYLKVPLSLCSVPVCLSVSLSIFFLSICLSLSFCQRICTCLSVCAVIYAFICFC